MAREYIYTGPGGPPVNFGTDTPVTQQQVGAVMAADNPLSALASFAASIPDFGIDALKGIVDLSRAQGQLFDRIGRQRPPFAQLAGSGLGKGLQSIPEGVVTEAVQNALTFGNRDKLIETMGGDTAFKAAPVLGTGMAIPLLASGALGTRVMKSFDVASDVLGATPGATQAFQAAKTGPQLLAASGGVGLGSSILPSVHYATDQATGEIDKSILGTGMLTGLGAGLGLPGLLAAPALAKGAAKGMKGALDSIVQGVGQAIKQSDNMKLYKQVKEREMQRMQMAAMTQKAEAETANFYKPEQPQQQVVIYREGESPLIKDTPSQPYAQTDGTTDRTFAKEAGGYEEQPNITKMQEEDLTRLAAEEAKHAEEFQATSSKLEKELDTTAAYIEEAKAKPIEVTEKEVVDSFTGPKTKREIVDNLRAWKKTEMEATQGKAKAAAKAELDTAMSKQMTLKEKQKNLAKLMKEKTPEELQKEFGKPVDKIQRSLEKEILTNEKGIGKIQKKLESIDKKLEKSVPVKRQEVEAEVTRVNEEKEALRQKIFKEKETEQQALVQDLEKEAENLFAKYEKEKAGHQKKLEKVQKQKQEVESFAAKPQLPAVIPEAAAAPRPRFISGPQGIKEYDPVTGKPVEVKESVSVTPEGDVVIKGGKQKSVAKMLEGKKLTPEDLNPERSFGKFYKNLQTVRKRLYRISKKLANKFNRSLQTAKFMRHELFKQVKGTGLDKALNKYVNDNDVMSTLGEVVAGRQQKTALPTDLLKSLEAMQPEFEKMKTFLKSVGHEVPDSKGELYFPFDVQDLSKLREINEDARSSISTYLKELNQSSAEPVTIDNINQKDIAGLNTRFEKGRVIKKYTPDMMDAYKPMPEALEGLIDRYATVHGDAELFGGNLDQDIFSELIPRLVMESDDLAAKDIPLAVDQLRKVFMERDMSPNTASAMVVKVIQSAVSGVLVTAPTTLLAQLTSSITNLRRSGLLSTIEGGFNALKAMTGKGPSYTEFLNPHNTMQNLNDAGLESFQTLKNYLMSKRTGVGGKVGKTVRKGAFAPLQFVDRWGEKESTYQTQLAWLKNNLNKSNFKIFEDRYGSIFTPGEMDSLKRRLKLAKKGRHKDVIRDKLINRAIDARAGEQLVTSEWDRSPVALGNEPGKLFLTFQSFAQKFADEVDMNTRQMIVEGIKENNPQKIRSGVAMAAGFVAVLPAYILANELRLGETKETAWKDAQKPGKILTEGIRQANPVLARTMDAIASVQRGGNTGKAMIDYASPGVGTLAKIGGDTLGTAARGENPFSFDKNPSARYLPPRVIMEPLYQASHAGREAKGNKITRRSKVLEANRVKKRAKYALEHGQLNAGNIDKLRTDKFKDELAEFKRNRSRLENYQTTDAVEAATARIYKEAYPIVERDVKRRLEAHYAAGKITKKQHDDVLNHLSEYTMKVVKSEFKKGNL
jgi:hypothetical protein